GQVTDLEMAVFEADHAVDANGTDHALLLAHQAYDARPDNIYAADALAWALYRAGRLDDAVALSDRALRLGTVDPLLHFHAAVIADALGRDERARTELAPVVAHTPWFSVRYHDDALALAARLGLTSRGTPS